VHPSFWSRDWLAVLAVGALAWALLLTVRQQLTSWLLRRRLRLRMRRARRGELLAQRLLEALGYSVVGSQVCSGYAVSIDDRYVPIAVRADYLVERDGLRYVAEVKTGPVAPRIQTPATRRQLLEYRVAFDVAGVLLVDAETQRVQVVRFPRVDRSAGAPTNHRVWLIVALIFVAFTVVLLRCHPQ
jgi:hypothetical protein